MANNAQANALLAHVASQMQLNVAFLESQNYLSAQDAATMKDIIQRLPVGTTQDEKQVLPDPPRAAPVYARALWAYNENGTVKGDLSFSAGDMVEIVAETNKDWWVGRVHGREALFPSNYVEKVQTVGNPEKKDKLGQYKNTMAHSAAGGLGFGAGAAIGGGLVRAIF